MKYEFEQYAHLNSGCRCRRLLRHLTTCALWVLLVIAFGLYATWLVFTTVPFDYDHWLFHWIMRIVWQSALVFGNMAGVFAFFSLLITIFKSWFGAENEEEEDIRRAEEKGKRDAQRDLIRLKRGGRIKQEELNGALLVKQEELV